MTLHHGKALMLMLVLLGMSVTLAQSTPPALAQLSTEPTALARPGLFIENVGQFEAAARFQALINGGVIWIADDALWLTLWKPVAAGSPKHQTPAGVSIRLSYITANARYAPEPFSRQETRVSYFKGSDSRNWQA